MVGELICVQGRGRGKAEPSSLGPLAAARWTVYVPEGLSPRRLARRLLRAERGLAKLGAGRVVLRGGFPYGDRLRLLRPVDPLPLWRGLAAELALGALEREGVPPGGELTAAAERLCPLVRGLVIDAPGGEDYARSLQARFGLPVTPSAAGADVTAAFGPGGGRWGRCLELHGAVDLGGLTVGAAGLELPEDCADQVLALLWEQGLVKREGLAIR